MMIKSWKVIASCLAVLIVIYSGYCLYQSLTTLKIWGFQVKKSQLILVRVDTSENHISHAYEVRNPTLVLEIAKEASQMKRVEPITAMNFPLSQNYKPITKLQIVSKRTGTMGGSLWFYGNDSTVWQDANGYYWSVPEELIVNLEKVIKSKETSKLF